MKTRTLALIALLMLAACSKVTQDNFARIQDGMSEQEVNTVLGAPTTSSTVEVLGISGTHSRWESSDAVISVRFVNGKVATKSYRKPDGKKEP
jgi:hypothetical protein